MRWWQCCLFLFISTLVVSCGISERKPDKIDFGFKATGGPLVRKIWVVPTPGMMAVYPESWQWVMGKSLMKGVEDKINNIQLLYGPAADAEGLPEKLPVLPDGNVNVATVNRLSKEAGLTSIIGYNIIDFADKNQADTTYIPFSSSDTTGVTITTSVIAFDPVTAAKIVDFSTPVDVDVEKNIKDSLLGLRFSEVNPESVVDTPGFKTGQALGKAIEDITWRGYVQSVDGARVVIAPGSETGLKPDDILEIYAPGRTIDGVNGLKYVVPGSQIGMVKIVSATHGGAEAMVLTEAEVLPGAVIIMPEKESFFDIF